MSNEAGAAVPSYLCSDDPRIDAAHLSYHPATETAAETLLIGTLHDHPASCYRVETLADAFDPDAVALEVSSAALPLFEAYAADDSLSHLGGEMSATIRAVPDAKTLGADCIDGEFLRILAREAYAHRDALSVETLQRLGTAIGSVIATSVSCSTGAALTRWTPFTVTVSGVSQFSTGYECTSESSARNQADEEEEQISTSLSVLSALSEPLHVQLRDTTREVAMARRIHRQRKTERVVAVVGRSHLEDVGALIDEMTT